MKSMRHILLVLLFCSPGMANELRGDIDKTFSSDGISAIVNPHEPATSRGMPVDFAPQYEVRQESSHMVEMRDGTRLSTDLYFPVGITERLPVILVRTPYGKENYGPEELARTGKPSYARGSALLMASQGYVVAVQDKRGQGESEDRFSAAWEITWDREDGYDTVSWIVDQDWSNGKVGSIGCSADGDFQTALMTMNHPNYTAAIPQAAAGVVGSMGGYYEYFQMFDAGVFKPGMLAWFMDNNRKFTPKLPADLSREEYVALSRSFGLKHIPFDQLVDDLESIYWTLPVKDFMNRHGPFPDEDWENFATKPVTDDYWQQFRFFTDEETFSTPALHIISWHDEAIEETFYFQDVMSRRATTDAARDHQYVVVAPGSHCDYDSNSTAKIVGDRNVGDVRFDYWGTYLDWFAYWLKGERNGILERLPPVQAFILGRNEWRSYEQWPPQGVTPTDLYLTSDGRANSRLGDGRLVWRSAEASRQDRYVYDPAHPVPSRGEQTDKADLELRQDILVYTSEPLADALELLGPVRAELYVSSDAKDTDFVVTLVEVLPDGTAYKIADGIAQARYREGLDREVWMEEGEVYGLGVELPPVGIRIALGHRLRVEVTSSEFPKYIRNLNTGKNNGTGTEWVPAKNAVHHGDRYASRIVLPVAPEDAGTPIERPYAE